MFEMCMHSINTFQKGCWDQLVRVDFILPCLKDVNGSCHNHSLVGASLFIVLRSEIYWIQILFVKRWYIPYYFFCKSRLLTISSTTLATVCFYWIQKNTSPLSTYTKGESRFSGSLLDPTQQWPVPIKSFHEWDIYIYRSPKRAAKTRPEATHRSNGTIAEIREWIRKKKYVN
jgi:hypothetical protein